MRAVAISEYGAEPAVTQVPEPEAGVDDLLIKIQAAGVDPDGPVDRRGAWQAQIPAAFPMIIGSDFAGVVEAVGERVTRFSRGEEVFGQSIVAPLGSAGTYAEYVGAVRRGASCPAPQGRRAERRRRVYRPGGHGASDRRRARAASREDRGDRGAAGGVGSFATQLVPPPAPA